MKDIELEKSISEFVGAFEVVFRYDWQYTREMISDEKSGAAFIESGLENNSWEERRVLLEKYSQLIAIMQKNNLEPYFSSPLEALPDFKQRVW